jgi:hypothetical protein
MAETLNLIGIVEHKGSGKQDFIDLVLTSSIYNMKMLDYTQVLEQLYRFDTLDSAS